MRWHKAHRNKQRSLRPKPKTAPVNPSWREWLEKILPHMHQMAIYEDSVFARIWKRAAEQRAGAHYRAVAFPRLPGRERSEAMAATAYAVKYSNVFQASPNRLEILARNIWMSQNGRCAECDVPVNFEDSTKRRHSFKIICRKCYAKSPAMFIVVDDLDGVPWDEVKHELS